MVLLLLPAQGCSKAQNEKPESSKKTVVDNLVGNGDFEQHTVQFQNDSPNPIAIELLKNSSKRGSILFDTGC